MYPDVYITCSACGHSQILDPADYEPECEQCDSTHFTHHDDPEYGRFTSHDKEESGEPREDGGR